MYFHYLFSSLKEITQKKNSLYPMIFVPEELKNILDKEIPLDFDEPLRPRQPIKTKVDVREYFIILIPLTLILLISTIISTDTAGIIFITGCILILFHWTYLNNKSTNSFLNELSKYEENISKYNTLYKEYTTKKNSIRTYENNENYRRKLINELFSKSQKPTKHCTSKKGLSEAYFENYLNIWFKGKIFKNYTFHLKDNQQAFIPDFIYQYKNLHIDIEIDEPYTLDSRTAIHYLANKDEIETHIDMQRNDLFTNYLKWVVIRFTEEQVVKQPNECCYVIDKVIDLITKNPSELNSVERIDFSNEGDKGSIVDKSFLYHLEKVELRAGDFRSAYIKNISLRKSMAFFGIKTVKAWTESEARALAKSNHRETYLANLTEVEQVLNTWNNKIELDKKTNTHPIFHPPITNNEPDWLDNDSDDLPF